jgi:hypothetical protein
MRAGNLEALIALAVLAAAPAGCERRSATELDDHIAAFRDRPEHMASVRVDIDPEQVDRLLAAWGDPTAIRLRGESAQVWLAPAARKRAMLVAERKLSIEPYLPATTIVPPRGRPLGIESAREFVDATPAELEAAYPGRTRRVTGDQVTMTWPPDEYGRELEVELWLRAGKVACIRYALQHGAVAAIAADRLALLEARYGASQPLADGRRQLSTSPRVIVRDTGEAWTVQVCKP